MKLDSDTIAALATGAAPAGVAVVRLSGACALACARRLAALPEPMPARTALLAAVHHPTTGALLDEALILYFAAPRSFTGEDVVEVHGHGGVRHVQALLEAVRAAGARAAEPGEFTRRAVLNGRMSLERAEALADLVCAETEAGLNAARSQLFGQLGETIGQLAAGGLALEAEVEAAIDFADEVDVPPDLAPRSAALAERCRHLAATHRVGRALRDGVRVVFAGAPNAGKSTLFNALLGEQRALVDAEPGTTRDALEARLEIGGIGFTLVDTAGLRDGAGRVEALGIERAREEIARGGVCVWVRDASAPVAPPAGDGVAWLRVTSKSDLVAGDAGDGLRLSARTGEGLEGLREALVRRVVGDEGPASGEMVVTHRRHAEEFVEAAEAFGRAARNAREAPLEIVAYDLRDAVSALERILGRGVNDNLLDEIFARFCIGK